MTTTRENVFRDKVGAYVDRHTNLKKEIYQDYLNACKELMELSDSSELDLSPKEDTMVFVPVILDYMYEEDNVHVEVQNINLENGELECVFVEDDGYTTDCPVDEDDLSFYDLITLFEVICNEIVKIEKDYL